MTVRRTTRAPGWFGRPVLSLLVGAAWLMLQGSLDPGNLLTAVVLGLVVPRLVGGFLGPRRRVQRPLAAARLVLVVLWDIVMANLSVARLVLSFWREPQPAWFTVKTDLVQPDALALLASIITMTPGTVSCIVSEGQAQTGGTILVHALDCDDPQATIAEIRERYERPLKEIFG